LEVDVKIKRYIAASMRAALSQVRAEQGLDAVILSTRRVNEGIEVIAAVDYDEALIAGAARRYVQAAVSAPSAEPAPAVPLRRRCALSPRRQPRSPRRRPRAPRLRRRVLSPLRGALSLPKRASCPRRCRALSLRHRWFVLCPRPLLLRRKRVRQCRR
jgi:flagellar biosynthesis protein FlhF